MKRDRGERGGERGITISNMLMLMMTRCEMMMTLLMHQLTSSFAVWWRSCRAWSCCVLCAMGGEGGREGGRTTDKLNATIVINQWPYLP
jgi:hypothetical protein